MADGKSETPKEVLSTPMETGTVPKIKEQSENGMGTAVATVSVLLIGLSAVAGLFYGLSLS